MRPSTSTQIRWGLIASLAAIALIAALALAPDPFFRQRVLQTTFDDVAGVSTGAPVYFRGAEIGAVRSVDLVPATGAFAIKLGVRRDWRASACSFAKINEINPMTPARIELVSLSVDRSACSTALAASGCALVTPATSGPAEAIAGCRRTPDFFQLASVAVADVTQVARSANLILAGYNRTEGQGTGADLAQLVDNARSSAAAANEFAQRLDRSMAPGEGDLAVTLANARQASGRAATIDVASLNASLSEMKDLIAQNQQTVTAVLSQSRDMTADGRALLETMSSSLVDSANALQRTSASLDALSQRLASDPTYAVRGQRFVDPPPVRGGR